MTDWVLKDPSILLAIGLSVVGAPSPKAMAAVPSCSGSAKIRSPADVNGKLVGVRGRFFAATPKEGQHVSAIVEFGVIEYPGLFKTP
jgi:hypothetical protein